MTLARITRLLRVDAARAVILGAALVLLYTGSAKLTGPRAFAETIASHALLPRDLAPQIAWGVIAMELAVGTGALWLVLAQGRLRAAAASLALAFTAFAWYAGALVVFPPPAPASCGCAGSASALPADWGAITARNTLAAAGLALVACAAINARFEPRERRVLAPAM